MTIVRHLPVGRSWFSGGGKRGPPPPRAASPGSGGRPRAGGQSDRTRSGQARSRGWTLAVVSVAAFMLMLDITVVNVALPEIRRGLGASFSDLQWVLDAYALTLAIFLLTAGSLGDIFGRRRVFIAGFAAFTIASLAAGLAQTALELNLARAGEGIGGAVLYAVGPALIGQEFRGRQRGMAFGIFGGVSGLAIALGPLVGGVLTGSAGWRWIFLINVPIGAAAMALAWWRVRDSRNPKAAGVDWAGMSTFSAALGMLVFALIRGGSLGWHSPVIFGLLGGAAVMLAGFVLIERARGQDAMFDLSLVRNVTFTGVSAVAFLSNAAVLPAIFLEVSYVQNVRGFSPLVTGERFLPLTLTLFLTAAAAGALLGRVPPRLLLGGSLLLIAAGILLFAHVSNQDPWTALIPSMIATGAGMGMSNVVRSATAIGVADPARAGMTSGINETFQQVGVVVGIAALGSFFEGRVAAAFHHAAAAGSPGATSAAAGRAIAAGNLTAAARHVPAGMAGSIVQAGRGAFLAGLHDVLLVAAAIALAGAIAAFALIRSRDLHVTALSAVPPEVDPEPSVPADPADEGDPPNVY
jgi:EmrB/QacA subfamily drug resistance transporter